ncbi:precorrin-3B C17-methyltransferase [Sporobacter termitidis DSM 10068]|uniref:Precorrin-3B C17-methyltransferase n=1 Tax=Sporobacter termitidis DSM 10068 TaxID=1123282 RepID=A0A1M5XJR9_9FIRM|nr:precorrin-3B C(17)-methyltransferase [Sporobacter termitidis]SHH99996.1 precorrin-3B C17-methyltransferase [Sporobacter termitidis DSM 10068]
MGKLYVVGLGPGKAEGMTREAHAALTKSELICGYSKYIELVRPLYPDKAYLSTGMCSEIDRCRAALEAAADKTVSMVCSGDAGVYGMAGLIYELSAEMPSVEIEIIPGVTAAQSGGAILGAPLMQDYAVISLSDLLVSWATIEKRLRGAAAGDFAVVLYNPSSHKRKDHLKRACDILMEYKSGETVCGIVRNIGRAGEDSAILTLAALRDTEVDMFTTVFIGSGNTRVVAGKMVTPRGYEGKK